MFKNCVIRKDVDTVKWAEKAGIRAVKTFAGFITVGAAVSEINWKYALSVSAVAFVYSVVISVAGIPEAESEE